MNPVLVTGATGFVGRIFCAVLAGSGYRVRAATRAPGTAPECVAEQVTVGEIGGSTDWQRALEGVELVVHLAARAHVLHESGTNSNLYRKTNTEATAGLANAAAIAGVRRFVYLSSIKVNGEETEDRAYTANDAVDPQDAYGVSKWLAEKSLLEMTKRSDMEVIIVRPPLIYGPGVKANFLRLLRWVDRQWPLPLGRVRNRRSLVSIWNLCDLLVNALSHRGPVRGTYLVSDGRDLSTPELIRQIAAAMHRPALLFPVPTRLLRAMGAVCGREREVSRLCGSLQVDISATRTALGWSPPLSVEEGIARTVTWYLAQGRG